MSINSSSQIITDGATEIIVSRDAAMLLTWSGLPKLQPWRQSPSEDGRPAIAIQLESGSEVATISTCHDCLKALYKETKAAGQKQAERKYREAEEERGEQFELDACERFSRREDCVKPLIEHHFVDVRHNISSAWPYDTILFSVYGLSASRCRTAHEALD